MAKILGLFVCVCVAVVVNGPVSQQPVDYREKVVEVAKSQLHVRELTGNNDGPQIDAYLQVTGLGPGYPWCAAYVSWVFKHAGVNTIRSARAADWFKPSSLVWESKALGKYQDFEFQQAMLLSFWYDNLGRIGHIAIGLNQDKNNYYTIEGNTNAAGEREGQGVELKIRPKRMIYSISDHIKSAA